MSRLLQPRGTHEDLLPACPEGWLHKGYRPTICLWAGLFVAVVHALVAEVLGFLPSGHQLNDPILLALAPGTLLRGTQYFNWTYFLLALLFSAYLGLATLASLRWLATRAGRQVRMQGLDRSVRIAAFASALPVLIQEIDAFQVLLWYGFATWLSMLIAGFSARSVGRRLKWLAG